MLDSDICSSSGGISSSQYSLHSDACACHTKLRLTCKQFKACKTVTATGLHQALTSIAPTGNVFLQMGHGTAPVSCSVMSLLPISRTPMTSLLVPWFWNTAQLALLWSSHSSNCHGYWLLRTFYTNGQPLFSGHMALMTLLSGMWIMNCHSWQELDTRSEKKQSSKAALRWVRGGI
jgi:hypothetical protein